MGELLPKPLYGEPCNGCGLCCIAVQCPISLALFGDQELCPALEQASPSLACGLVRNTADYVSDMTEWGGKALTEAFGLLVGAGCGCDGAASAEDEARQDEYRPIIKASADAMIAKASPEAQVLVAYFRAPSTPNREERGL